MLPRAELGAPGEQDPAPFVQSQVAEKVDFAGSEGPHPAPGETGIRFAVFEQASHHLFVAGAGVEDPGDDDPVGSVDGDAGEKPPAAPGQFDDPVAAEGGVGSAVRIETDH